MASRNVLAIVLCCSVRVLCAQAPDGVPAAVPAWAQPGSATHVQVAPPADFHRPSRNFDTPIGVLSGGIGFCSHLPDKADTAVLSNVVLENAAGKVR